MHRNPFHVLGGPKLQRSKRIISIVLSLIPVIYVLNLALHSGAIPTHDYWAMISKFYSNEGFSNHPADWLFYFNQIMPLSFMVYALNIVVTGGSNIGLSLITWFFALIQMFILIVLLPKINWKSGIFIVILPVVISVFTFTPSASMNWIFGFNGVFRTLPSLFVIASIFCLTRFIRNEHIHWIIGAIALALLATLTHSSSLVIWPACFVGLFLMRFRLRVVLVFLGFSVVILAGYSYCFKISNNVIAVFTQIHKIVLYVATWLGGIFTTKVEIALLAGVFGLLASSVMFWLFVSRVKGRIHLFPWILIHIYAIGMAFVTAMARSHRGLDQAISSRYAVLAALYWLSLIVILIFHVHSISMRWQWRAIVPILIIIILAISSMYQVGMRYARSLIYRASLQPIASLSAQLGIPDLDAIRLFITPSHHAFVENIPALEAHGGIPFHKENPFCVRLNQRIDSDLLNPVPKDDIPGCFESLYRYTKDGVRGMGWVYKANHKVKCIILLNRDNVIRGIGQPGIKRPDIADELDISEEKLGWVGYARIGEDDKKLTAYALFSDETRWTRLRKSHSLKKSRRLNTPNHPFKTLRGLQKWRRAGTFLSEKWESFFKRLF